MAASALIEAGLVKVQSTVGRAGAGRATTPERAAPPRVIGQAVRGGGGGGPGGFAGSA